MKKLAAFCIALALVCGLATGCAEPSQSGTQAGQVQPPEPEQSIEPTFYLAEDVNPYTGLKKAEGYPQGRRGVAVMINNVRTALPQSGINDADVLYEMVTESGITRLMALYRDYASMPVVGPLRSARDQHVQLMIPLDCLYAHIGTSTHAAEMLETYRYLDTKAIDGKYRTFYWIDAERRKTLGQEHCVYMDGETFAKAAGQYGLDDAGEPAPIFNFMPYAAPPRELADGDAGQVYIRFSSYADSLFTYNTKTGRYDKQEFSQPQVDANTGRQYSADNLLLLFADVDKYPDGVLTHINFDAQGVGLYFNKGRYEVVRWMKGKPNAPLRIVDAGGSETDVFINPGQTYVAVVGMDQVEHCRVDEVAVGDL